MKMIQKRLVLTGKSVHIRQILKEASNHFATVDEWLEHTLKQKNGPSARLNQ